MTVPCECCPTGLSRCWAPTNPLSCNAGTLTELPTIATPTSAAVVGNPLGYTFTGPITRTHDGIVANDTGNWRIRTSGAAQNTGVTVRWSYTADQDDVISFSMWHGAGGILNDCDGVFSATLTVYDAAVNVLFTGPAVTGNSGAQWTTAFPAALDGVRHFELSQISKCAGAPDIYVREVRLNRQWRATLQYSCPPFTMTGDVETQALTSAGGLVLTPTTLAQTNGPHDIVWHVPADVTGTVTTDHPERFSTLTITDGTVMTVTGNGTSQFAVTWVSDDLDDIALPAHGLLCDGETTWFDGDGTEIPPALLRDCPAG